MAAGMHFSPLWRGGHGREVKKSECTGPSTVMKNVAVVGRWPLISGGATVFIKDTSEWKDEDNIKCIQICAFLITSHCVSIHKQWSTLAFLQLLPIMKQLKRKMLT